ncbi:hypothetical protein IH981_03105 [Patescibacteria group bacterium]|nr:hypothetical protein [Patescibacteria group bacterium]
MGTSSSAAVITCLDPRIQETVRRLRLTLGLPEGTYTPHHPPGASLNITSEERRLDLSILDLGSRLIVVIDHEDCLAYKRWCDPGKYTLQSHLDNLHRAKVWLENRYPKRSVRLYLLKKITDEEWEIETIRT